MSALPAKFKAIRRHDEHNDIRVDSDISMPKPGKCEVLVKVMAAPCNPSDDYFLHGYYGDDKVKPKPPVGTGLEGSGVVVEVGESVPAEWVGKRVTMFCETFNFISFMGCWGQYTIKNINDIFEIPKELGHDYASFLLVNPMTVIGLLKRYKDATKKSAIVHLAACSAVGKSLAKVCIKNGIPLINIVRSNEHVKYLKEELKSPYTLNSDDKNFEKDLAELFTKLNPSLVLDPVVGKVSNIVFHLLPMYAEHVIYGGLEGTGINAGVTDCLAMRKSVTGFWLSEMWPKLTNIEKNQWVKEAIDDMMSKDSAYKQPIVATYKLEDFEKLLKDYKTVASKGKLIIHPFD